MYGSENRADSSGAGCAGSIPAGRAIDHSCMRKRAFFTLAVKYFEGCSEWADRFVNPIEEAEEFRHANRGDRRDESVKNFVLLSCNLNLLTEDGI